MKPTVRSLSQANYPIREVDVTRDPQMARDFRIDRIPCFVMLVNGQEVDRVVGATSSERLVQMFDRARVRLQSPDVQQARPLRAAVARDVDAARARRELSRAESTDRSV